MKKWYDEVKQIVIREAFAYYYIIHYLNSNPNLSCASIASWQFNIRT